MVIHLLPPFPWIEPRDGLLKMFLRCAGLQVMAPVGAGILVFFSTRGRAAKGSPFVQKVRLTALSLQCSSAPPSVLAGRSCAHFADAGVPGLSCCCCALRPALRCRSCARCPSRWAIALRRHVRSCSPRAVHRTHPLDPACAGLDERGYQTRCGGSSGMQILPRTQWWTIKFSRGAAPRTP